jgi:DNA modification methylase
METGVVLDPFLGTGTTAYVAKQLGFSYLGYELDTNYFNYAKERLSDDC